MHGFAVALTSSGVLADSRESTMDLSVCHQRAPGLDGGLSQYDLTSVRNGNLDERSYLSVHDVSLQGLPPSFP